MLELVSIPLVSIPSTAERPEDLRRALEFVLAVVGPGFTVERFESRGKPSALVYPGPGRPRFRVILNAHLDVVPGLPEQFRPRLEGTRLYGRGTQDMKVSALVQAMVFADLAATLAHPIALQLVTDAEVGGRDGTLHQLDQGVVGDFVIIGEQSRLRVATESRGVVTASLRAEGRGGHSAYQWLGDNAIIKLVRSVDRLLAGYPVATEEVWRTTVNVARIETTSWDLNQIPSEARAWLDIRFPAEDADLNGRTPEEITEHLTGFCVPGVTVSVIGADPPHRVDHQRCEVRLLQQAARNQGYRADILRKHRRSGRSWLDVVTIEERPLIVERITCAMDSLATKGGRWRRKQARALRAEGVSINRIAALYGVTRQRISALVRDREGGGGADRPT